MIDFKVALHRFIARRGIPVDVIDDDYRRVSPYSWMHVAAWAHSQDDKCSWTVPETAEIIERSYSVFVDTYQDNENEVGLEVDGASCACGKYTDMSLRWVGGFGKLITALSEESDN